MLEHLVSRWIKIGRESVMEAANNALYSPVLDLGRRDRPVVIITNESRSLVESRFIRGTCQNPQWLRKRKWVCAQPNACHQHNKEGEGKGNES